MNKEEGYDFFKVNSVFSEDDDDDERQTNYN